MNQHADGHVPHFCIAQMAHTKQDNGISARQDHHHLLSLRVYWVLSCELAHCLPTNRGNAASLTPPPNDRLVVVLWQVLTFLFAHLFNLKSPWLTLPFLPMPLPHVMKQQRPLSHPSRVTALPSKNGIRSIAHLVWKFSHFLFPMRQLFNWNLLHLILPFLPTPLSERINCQRLLPRHSMQQPCHQKRIRDIAHLVCEFSHLVFLFSTI